MLPEEIEVYKLAFRLDRDGHHDMANYVMYALYLANDVTNEDTLHRIRLEAERYWRLANKLGIGLDVQAQEQQVHDGGRIRSRLDRQRLDSLPRFTEEHLGAFPPERPEDGRAESSLQREGQRNRGRPFWEYGD